MTFLKLDKVVKKFGGLIAINGVSLSIKQNEFVGLIGPNGAGKTTLINLIAGFYKVDKGVIIFENEPINNKKPNEICKLGIARTFQQSRIFPSMSVFDNVKTAAFLWNRDISKAADRALELLDFVKLRDKAMLPASSLNTPEKKLLELARALATEPKLLLIDEIFSGFPQMEIDNVLKLLRDIHSKGITIIMIEHVMRAVMSTCKRVIVLNEGKVICDGSPSEVAREPKVISAYLGEEYRA